MNFFSKMLRRKTDLVEELNTHLRMAVAERVANGESQESAEREALREFGNVPLIADVTRERWGWLRLENFVQDIRYALRQMWKTPGFTATAILTLALGIGANTAIFTLVNAMLLKNLPVADPKALVRIGDAYQCCVNNGALADGDYALFSTNTYEQFRKNTPEFEELAAMESGFNFSNPMTARRDGAGSVPYSSVGEFVSGNYFSTFGLQAQAGRLLSEADDVKGAPVVGVMSYETWKNHYNHDPSIIGSTFWINTRPVTVVGIAPRGFYGDRLSTAPPDFYFPMKQIGQLKGADYVDNPDRMWLYIIGRVRPGVDRAALQTKLSGELRQLLAPTQSFSSVQDRPLLEKAHVVLTDGGSGIQIMQLDYTSKLTLLMWISGLVLLIACANIANLLLVRGMARKAEISVRTALGAARGRVIQQLLTESIVLSVLGGIAALGVSYLGTRMLLALAFAGTNIPIHAMPSWEVLGFALAVSLATGLLFGVAPAWVAAQSAPVDALRGGTRATTGGASLLQRSLVVLQTALSLVLLVGAGLFTASLNKLQNTDLKLESRNRYIIHIDPQAAGYLPSQVGALYQAIEENFHAVPGVVKVGISTVTPMEARNNNDAVQIQGQPDLHKMAGWNRVNADYFDAVGTRLVMGRSISVQDTPSEPMVAVVNQSFVKTFFKPGENPIGAHYGDPGPSPNAATIVGVVEDTVYTDVREKSHPMTFIPILQRAASDKRPLDKVSSLYAGTIVLETSRPMDDLQNIARRTLSAINPNLTVMKFQTFEEQIAGSFTQERMLSRLMMLFGGLALLLATIGLYGVTSYTVARRTSEIGIRMALGAERGLILAMILRSALTQSLLGLAIGIPVAFYCVQFVKSQLYEMTNVSVSSMAIAIVTLLVAELVAGLIPGRRAASIDPMRALRAE